MIHTEKSGMILAHDDMTDEDIVVFLRANGQRLCPPGCGESIVRGENAPNYKHLLGREMQRLADVVERRLVKG